MDITRFNFWHTLPVVLETISFSNYVAFDLEMTGVTGHSNNKTSAYTQSTAYRLAVEAAITFQSLWPDLPLLRRQAKGSLHLHEYSLMEMANINVRHHFFSRVLDTKYMASQLGGTKERGGEGGGQCSAVGM